MAFVTKPGAIEADPATTQTTWDAIENWSRRGGTCSTSRRPGTPATRGSDVVAPLGGAVVDPDAAATCSAAQPGDRSAPGVAARADATLFLERAPRA